MKKYDTYKESGIEWLGEIPEHWSLVNMKYLLKTPLKYGANESAEIDNPDLPRYIRITDFGENGKLRKETFKSLPFEKAEDYMLEEGDILFARSGATVGKTFQFKNYDGQACFAGYLIKASPDEEKVLSDYLYFYTKSNSYLSWKDSIFNQATIQNIGADKYKDLKIVFPSLFEQAKIVSFLDHKTIQIDTLIEKKEQLVEKLTLKRQAIINEAVTKGLNPNVPMKDSGIEWLGEIPEHWELTSVKNILDIPITDGPHTTPELYDEGIPFISAEAIKEGKIDFERKRGYISKKDYIEYSKKYLPNLYDIYMVKSGATTGNIAMVETDNIFTIWSPLAVFRANSKKMHYAYLYNFLESAFFKYQVELNWSYGTQQNIGMGVLSNLKIIYPDVSEQKLICNAIKIKTNHIDTLVKQINTSIEKLKLYRQSLISEAVTGKIDLRDWKQTDNK